MTCRTALKSTALAAVLSAASAFSAQAVFFHVGSGSIDGSLCVGNDCVSSEAFGFDTVRLKENNLRLHFDDTSTAASFPPNDWRLIANDSANGGSSHFSIEDATAGRQVFRVFAGARSNALVVDAQGDLGLGTATPATDIDIKTGNTPTVRLQQDGTSGFAPQTWDMAGNEAGFFIRDATNGSTLPFRIIPGASSNSLVIDDDNDIGMGAGTNPDSPLHVERNTTDFVSMLHLENSNAGASGVAFRITNGSTVIDTNNIGGDYRVNFDDGDNWEMQLDTDGNLTIDGTLTVTGGTTVPDYVFADDYELMPLADVEAFILENRHLPRIPSARTVGEAGLNMTGMQMALLEKVEELTLYTLAQQKTIDALQQRLDAVAD